MADSIPSDQSPNATNEEVETKTSENTPENTHETTAENTAENTPLESEERSRSASPDSSDLDALAAEFNEAEKAVIENEPADDDEKLAPKGSICEVKQIFDIGTSDCGCCIEWVDQKPERDRTEENKAAENRRAQFSVIRRMTPHGAGGWKTHSILVNSSSIKASLAKVFEGYPVTYADDHDLKLYPGFIPFCHRWDKLLEVEQEEPEPETKSHLNLLRSTLEVELSDSLKRRDLVARTGFASFDDLELLFEPKQIVIQRHSGGILSAGRVRKVTLVDSYGTRYYNVKVYTTAWNSEQFGMDTSTWQLNNFDGTMKVHSLDIFPLHMHPDREKISRELIERGKKYERLRGQHFLAYAGKVGSKYIKDRVIVDEQGYWELSDNALPSLTSFDESTKTNVIPGLDECNHASNDNGTDEAASTEEVHPSNGESTDHTSLTNYQLLLASWSVSAFALKTKTWYDLDVDGIQEIDWIPDLMTKLVLDQDTKDLVVALIDYKTTHTADDEEMFDDFVPGKGKGIITLLCGPPGVGKTLMAEAVSEHSKSPLYRVNVQDLGSNVSDLEEGLQKAMKRCSRWNAVLLLDEAEVFLEERSLDSLQRNELVSIFLREIEYYQGIMILTTNRATTIDPAFESRIDVTLTFEPLPKEARRQIWDGFLADVHPAAQLSDEERDRLADWVLNGRQIKSAVKTASIFASSQGGPVTIKHLDVVIKLRNSSGAMIGSKKA